MGQKKYKYLKMVISPSLSKKLSDFDEIRYCRSGEEQSHKSPTPAVVRMSTVGLSSLFSFILRTHLAYDVSTNLER